MRKTDRCGCCGGTALVDAVDNHGKPYVGCARCRIALPEQPKSHEHPCSLCDRRFVCHFACAPESAKVVCDGCHNDITGARGDRSGE